MFKKFLTALAASIAVFGLLFSGLAVAAAGQGLEINRPLYDLKGDPGQTLSIKINVRNITQDPLVVKSQFEDFVAAGEDGRPKILLQANERSPYSIKDWLQATPSLTLKPGQREAIDVKINIPKDAGPGGHYGVVRFTGTPPELEDTGVSLSASVGSLILVNVSGDIKESAKIAEIFMSQNVKKDGRTVQERKSLFEYGPVIVTTRVQNTGNIHFKPKGTIQITNMIGRNVTTTQFNTADSNVLPGSIRKFQETLNKKYLFGRYKVNVDVVYGSNNQIASASKTFWVIPYKLIVIVILGIVALVYLAKLYNRSIIKRAGKSGHGRSGKKGKKG